MTNYLNCDKPESPFGPITCHFCSREYNIIFDGIKAPYKETGTLKCGCGLELVQWNSTSEPYLEPRKKITNEK